MYKHILIATDGSDVAKKGVEHGLALAKSLGARATVVMVSEPFPVLAGASSAGWVPSPADYERFLEANNAYAKEVLDAAAAAGTAQGVTVETRHIPDSPPAPTIVEVAKKAGCDLIVMGSHGRRGLGRLFLGSQTSEVLAHTPVPVLVVR